MCKTRFVVYNNTVYYLPPKYWRKLKARLREAGAIELPLSDHKPRDMLGLPQLREE